MRIQTGFQVKSSMLSLCSLSKQIELNSGCKTTQNEEPTCVGDRQPPPQEVEGPVGGVGHVAGQRFEVALSRQPAHKLRRVRVKLAIVQCV